MKINVGCGRTPTPGFRNFDNSLSVRIGRIPVLPTLAVRAGLLSTSQRRFSEMAEEIEYADIVRGLPLGDASCDLVYSSHTLEHLDRWEADRFCQETLRVLAPGGVLRLAVPDLERLARRYVTSGDADEFIASTLLSVTKPRSLKERLLFVTIGPRGHHWMYDARSLTGLLQRHGFVEIVSLAPGQTTISDPGELDLHERSSESVYVEARRPRVPDQ